MLPTLAPGDELTLELPFGGFQLRDDDPARPVLMIAGGTGFAPMQSILDDALARQPTRKFLLYWGSRDARGLYALNQVERWRRRHANFSYVAVVSEPASGPTGDAMLRKGLVHAAKSAFLETRGLPPERFFADAFATPADAAPAL